MVVTVNGIIATDPWNQQNCTLAVVLLAHLWQDPEICSWNHLLFLFFTLLYPFKFLGLNHAIFFFFVIKKKGGEAWFLICTCSHIEYFIQTPHIHSPLSSFQFKSVVIRVFYFALKRLI